MSDKTPAPPTVARAHPPLGIRLLVLGLLLLVVLVYVLLLAADAPALANRAVAFLTGVVWVVWALLVWEGATVARRRAPLLLAAAGIAVAGTITSALLQDRAWGGVPAVIGCAFMIASVVLPGARFPRRRTPTPTGYARQVPDAHLRRLGDASVDELDWALYRLIARSVVAQSPGRLPAVLRPHFRRVRVTDLDRPHAAKLTLIPHDADCPKMCVTVDVTRAQSVDGDLEGSVVVMAVGDDVEIARHVLDRLHRRHMVITATEYGVCIDPGATDTDPMERLIVQLILMEDYAVVAKFVGDA